MQTSFMHPPFGFALFYLRSVAPSRAYTDRLTKKLIQPVTTMQIYWGAIPFVIIQIIMVGLIIAFPGIVSSGLDKKVAVDLDKVGAEMMINMPGAEPEAPTPAAATDPTVPANPPDAGAAPASGSSPAPTPDAAAENDPMKAMEEAMKKK
jgi:GntP family gluconate:H+ symporter